MSGASVASRRRAVNTQCITTARNTYDVRGLYTIDCPRTPWMTEKLGRGEHPMDKPSEKNLSKMRTYAEKFAEKSGTYLHPEHEVTDVVVEGLARHIEEVGKP